MPIAQSWHTQTCADPSHRDISAFWKRLSPAVDCGWRYWFLRWCWRVV